MHYLQYDMPQSTCTCMLSRKFFVYGLWATKNRTSHKHAVPYTTENSSPVQNVFQTSTISFIISITSRCTRTQRVLAVAAELHTSLAVKCTLTHKHILQSKCRLCVLQPNTLTECFCHTSARLLQYRHMHKIPQCNARITSFFPLTSLAIIKTTAITFPVLQ